jgi:hypothetical protein
MKQSPVRILLILLFTFIGCFGVAYAAAGMLTALPTPAIGGTCGPSTGSETAAEALAKPGSIGAGPEPVKSNATAHHQWQTFIQQCQALADRRGLASLAILVISLVVAGIGLVWVLRKPKRDGDDTTPELDESAGAGTSSYAPLGLHDPGALVGAGAVVGAPGSPVAAWPSSQPPAYGAPPAYPPPGSGSPVDGGYPHQAWPAQPPPGPGTPEQQVYPQTPPGYPPQGYPSQPYPPQGYPPQAQPGQPSAYPPVNPPPGAYSAPAQQPYPQEGYPQQGYPSQPYPQQPYPPEGYPQQGYPSQGEPQQGQPQQSWPTPPPQAPPAEPQHRAIEQRANRDTALGHGSPGSDGSTPIELPPGPAPDDGGV